MFEIEQGIVDRGAELEFLSQYPHEKEVTFPPCTGFEIISTSVRAEALVVRLRPSVPRTGIVEQLSVKHKLKQLLGSQEEVLDQMKSRCCMARARKLKKLLESSDQMQKAIDGIATGPKTDSHPELRQSV